jgi:DNA-binding transcriptional MerR regulator
MSIDTLKVARRLREAGFTEPQAEAVVDAVREGDENSDVATTQDMALLRTELRAEMAAFRAEVTAEFAAMRAAAREAEQRLIARMEAIRSELLGKMFSMVVGAVLVNIVAMLGAIFAFAKLLGH